jgi:hypothetical protein
MSRHCAARCCGCIGRQKRQVGLFKEGLLVAFVSWFEQREREIEANSLLLGITAVLKVRFGAEGGMLRAEVWKETNPEWLRRFLAMSETASLAELQKLLPYPDHVWEQARQIREARSGPFVSWFEQREQELEARTLLRGIMELLELKFESEGRTLVPELLVQNDLETLRRFLMAIRPAKSLEDLRKLLP